MNRDTAGARPLDHHFADFICRLAGERSDGLHRAALLVSRAVGEGHVCADLEALEDRAALVASLRASGVAGSPGTFAPLVLDDESRLYLYRYWKYESELSESLKRKSRLSFPVMLPLLREGLDRFFGAPSGDGPDWQRVAAAAAVRGGFSVISGGPGTGKTSTVVKIIALLLEQSGGAELRISLAAPTGKAAARLSESIRDARERLGGVTPFSSLIPDDVATIHRLLGVIPGSSRFRHDRGNPLPCDVLVVDEASMVPLPLMAKLVDALSPTSRLILLGDRDQLASVEAGAVLGDICDTGRAHRFSPAFRHFIEDGTGERLEGEGETASPLADCLVILRKNYRFGADSGIGALSRAVNEGAADAALDLLHGGNCAGVTLCDVPPPDLLAAALRPAVVAGFSEYLAQEDPAAALAAFSRFRILCAVREGRYGLAGLNQTVEHLLADEGLITAGRRWYHGRPVMVTVNDYPLRLFNGDIGIALPDPEAVDGLAVFFPSPDGGLRKFSPHRLPPHETVFAMTVHKSQGSEFDSILMVVPPFDTPVLTRELLYTGITRARREVELWCTEDIFRSASARRVERSSGLRRALWG